MVNLGLSFLRVVLKNHVAIVSLQTSQTTLATFSSLGLKFFSFVGQPQLQL